MTSSSARRPANKDACCWFWLFKDITGRMGVPHPHLQSSTATTVGWWMQCRGPKGVFFFGGVLGVYFL